MPGSDSYFPTPKGGTLKNWADSYEKAAKLVEQMTLIEKINITTGTGWMMGMCVGNTGATAF
jgi:beta-glucosidase